MGRKTLSRPSGARSGRDSQIPLKQRSPHPEPTSASLRKSVSKTATESASKWLPYLIVAGCASIGAAILLYATNWGIGISPDSTVYINVARNLLKGYGFSNPPGTPMTHYPPFYPMVLSLSALWGQDPLDGARGIHAFLFWATLVLAGWIIYRETHGSMIASISGLLLLLASNTIIYVYSFAWSESLFMLLCLAGLLSLREYIEQTHVGLLLLSSLLVGFAFLTRYVGISVTITCCLCILLMSILGLYKRLIIAAGFGMMTLFPVSLWVLRNSLVAGTLTNRSLVSHPVTLQHVNAGISTISRWFFMPQDWPFEVKSGLLGAFAVIVLIACVSLLQYNLKMKGNKRIVFFPSIFIIFLFSYLVFLGFSISYIDAHTPLDNRILSPLYIIGVIALVCLSYHIWFYYGKRKVVAISLLFISFSFLIAQVLHSVPLVASLHYNGSGYADKYWKNSPIIGVVKSLPDNLVIFTNGPDPIDILTGKTSQMIPGKVDAGTRLDNKDFPSQFADMVRQIEDGKALLVYFSMITWRWYLPSQEELAAGLRVPVPYKGWDGMIFDTGRERKN